MWYSSQTGSKKGSLRLQMERTALEVRSFSVHLLSPSIFPQRHTIRREIGYFLRLL